MCLLREGSDAAARTKLAAAATTLAREHGAEHPRVRAAKAWLDEATEGTPIAAGEAPEATKPVR